MLKGPRRDLFLAGKCSLQASGASVGAVSGDAVSSEVEFGDVLAAGELPSYG